MKEYKRKVVKSKKKRKEIRKAKKKKIKNGGLAKKKFGTKFACSIESVRGHQSMLNRLDIDSAYLN